MTSKSLKKVYLLLLETQEQYQAYVEQKESLETHELSICCLSVAAIDYCKKNEIQFLLPEDCYTDEESDHYRDLSEQKIRELVKSLNNFYHQKFGANDGFLFDMGNYHFFMLYHFYGALHYRAFFLWKIIKKHNVDRILIPQEPKTTSVTRLFPVSQYPNCYLDLCLNSVYMEKIIPLPMKSVVVRSYASPRTKLRSVIGKTFRKFRIFNDYLNHVQQNIVVSPWSLIFNRSRTKVLLLGSAGPWKHVFPDPRLKNNVSVFFEADEVSLVRGDIKNWFSEWFNWNDVFCGFEVSALGFYEMTRIKVLSEKFVASHRKTLKRIKQQNALIYSGSPYASQQYFLSVAKHLGIPRVCFQHGEMSLYHPGLWCASSELLYISHYFSYGDQVSQEKTRSAAAVPGFDKAISIGSPALDKLKKTALQEKDCILYASAKFLNYSASFVPRYIDVAVKDSHDLLIDYFEQYLDMNPGSQVIWKHNQERLTAQATKNVQKVIVIREEKAFTELLPEARIVVLDRPSTTSLEACMTRKPLFVLLANRNWYSLPEELLRKRAVIAYTVLELREAIDKFLTKGVYPADVTNKEFVMAYGCHLDDGLSTHRAVGELFGVMAGNISGEAIANAKTNPNEESSI